MTKSYDKKLIELGIILPSPPMPAANYIPYVLDQGLVYISGQISMDETGLVCGKLGENFTIAQGKDAAKLCAIGLIAQLKSACDGDLQRLVQVIKLGGFVNSTPQFTDHPAVINGASDLIGNVFGAAGTHARVAVGCVSLPKGVAVEIDGIFRIS